MELLGGALNTLKILAKRARYSLIDGARRVGVVWHADIDGFSREIARFVILEVRCLRVNHPSVPMCPEVPHFQEASSWAQTNLQSQRRETARQGARAKVAICDQRVARECTSSDRDQEAGY